MAVRCGQAAWLRWMNRAGMIAAKVALIALALLLPASDARGDGKVFPLLDHTASIPDQQALVVWDEAAKTQTLIVETRFIGTGPGAAWVVPVPGVPVVSEASKGLFPTLRVITAPRISKGEGWFALLVLSGAGWALLAVAITPRKYALLHVLWGSLLLVSAGAFLLPALGTARSAMLQGSVEVIDRRLIGAFDTAIIRGADGSELLAWLKENGYAVDSACGPVIGDYAKAGWVFVASRLRDEGAAAGAVRTPHPLAFTFASERPVYPMRLTGVGADSLGLDLYVLARGGAEVQGLDVRWRQDVCVPGVGNTVEHTGRAIEHPSLKPLVMSGAVLTRLSGALSTEQMTRDMDIAITTQAGEFRSDALTAGGAGWRAWALASCTGLAVMAVGCTTRPGARASRRRLAWAGVCALAAGGAAWVGARLTQDVAATSSTRWREMLVAKGLADQLYRLVETDEALRRELRMADDDAARLALLRERAKRLWLDEFNADPSTLPPETDAPGGYTIGLEGDEVIIRWHDARAWTVIEHRARLR